MELLKTRWFANAWVGLLTVVLTVLNFTYLPLSGEVTSTTDLLLLIIALIWIADVDKKYGIARWYQLVALVATALGLGLSLHLGNVFSPVHHGPALGIEVHYLNIVAVADLSLMIATFLYVLVAWTLVLLEKRRAC